MSIQIFVVLLVLLLSCFRPPCEAAVVAVTGGKWDLLQESIGIVAMHMQLLHNDKVVIYDRTDYGRSNISLPMGQCRNDTSDKVLKYDCTAHSVEYDVVANSARPLMVLTDLWCSGGSAVADGTLVQTGGFNDGDHVVRVFSPDIVGSDWKEINNSLIQTRWYATNHILLDDQQIIIGGRKQFKYEYYPKTPSNNKAFQLPFLAETYDYHQENNLFPFVFLMPDGNLFIFANSKSILFDYKRNLVVKRYPEIPGGDPRCYPSTGSAVLLPLTKLHGSRTEAEVMVCGGAPKGSFPRAQNGTFVGALKTCGRIKVTDQNPQWEMETMPYARVMGDMLLLPNGNVLIINGASNGTAGWEFSRDPVLNPVIYRPSYPIKTRFQVQNPSEIPRVYHSTAILLHDGRILVGGSNPHIYYNFTGVIFPTELRLESFSPSYLDQEFDHLRPEIISPDTQSRIRYDQSLFISFKILEKVQKELVKVTLLAPPFNTHSFSMNQRLLELRKRRIMMVGNSTYQMVVMTPNNVNLAPSGYYILFVVYQDIPSKGIWVHLQ